MEVVTGSIVTVAVLVFVAIVIGVFTFKAMWRVAEPNEALIISGIRSSSKDSSLGFKIVTGHGTLVIPGIQAVRRLSLDLREADLRSTASRIRVSP